VRRLSDTKAARKEGKVPKGAVPADENRG
jgi:hypothetical protein